MAKSSGESNPLSGMFTISFLCNMLWSVACATFIGGASGNVTASAMCFAILMISGLIGIGSFYKNMKEETKKMEGRTVSIHDRSPFPISKSSEKREDDLISNLYMVVFFRMNGFWGIAVCLIVVGVVLALMRRD